MLIREKVDRKDALNFGQSLCKWFLLTDVDNNVFDSKSRTMLVKMGS